MAYENYDPTYIEDEKPDLSWKSIKDYLISRPITLFQLPHTSISSLNPLPALRAMKLRHWNWYMLGFLAWTVDAMDFFVVSASASAIAESLKVSIVDITWGMTLVLMFRSVGAIIFGYIADTWGRKWSYISCCICFVCLEIGTGFITNYHQFLAIRALFGIAMGGMYGTAAATALENIPPVSHSLMSGLFLPGYNLGYIFAIIFYRALQFTYHGEGWRSLCWFTAGPAAILAVWRLCLPEGEYFLKLKEKREFERSISINKWREVKKAISTYWVVFVYLIFLMSGMNFMSHGTMDLYPTLLLTQAKLDTDAKTVVMVVSNLGAIAGGLLFGQLSELLGRRLCIMVCCVFGAAFIYPAFLSTNESGLMAGSTLVMAGVFGAWGQISIHLFELSPPNYRAFAAGLAYQLGNLASSASATIEATIGTQFPIEGRPGVYNYGKVMTIFSGAVFAYVMLMVFFGPERFHRDLYESVRPDDEKVEGPVEEKEVVQHVDYITKV